MQMIIEARLVDDDGETSPLRLALIDRELTTSTLGLSLAEGKALLASAQQSLCVLNVQVLLTLTRIASGAIPA